MSMDLPVDLSASCEACVHDQVCGLKATLLQATMMTVPKNPKANELGIGFVNTYSQICDHYLIKAQETEQ